MRVLHVLDHSLPHQSGYTFRTMRIIQCQREQGYDTSHVTGPKQGQVAHDLETENDLTFRRSRPLSGLKALPILRQVYTIVHLRRAIKKAIAMEKPDVLHVHSPVLNGLAALNLAKKHKLPIVYEIRAFWEDAGVDHGTHKANGLRYRLSRALESYIIKKANHVTTICQGLKSDLLKRGLHDSKITVIANGVDKSFFDKHQVDEALKKQIIQKYGLKDKFVIGFIGSFYAYEGLDLLIEAIARARASLGRFAVLLVGGGPEYDSIVALVKKLKLEDVVHLPGRVAHEQVATHYAVCDLCVYPRKKIRLTDLVTPLKPLEAMAQGVPVLASDVGGHKELITHGRTGFLFEAENLDSLCAALIQCKTQNRPMDVIFKAQNYILEERNWKKTTKPYEQIFKKASQG